ncbi:hypothetical protein Taro_010812 [Colocasia esculenta]|uniref:Uncharacterized protein n=1 Tax=Colocasia esculenta TaxID=4460 RepID=A0A843U430_COLES|nr:hypothetical protein [Colocasia esculenta]
MAVAPCAVSSNEREHYELLYLSELRVVLCKFADCYSYLNLVLISLDYSSNPFGSLDPWVVAQTSVSLVGVLEVGSLHKEP